MQTVWNRVAQTRVPCHGPSQAVKSCVARQTATTAGKRPTKFLTSSTLLYSGIFAVAATTDALVKEKRRKQWDEAIADAKQGIEKVEGQTQGIRHGQVEELVELDGLLDLADAEYEAPYAMDGVRALPGHTGQPLHQSAFAPQSIYASREWQQGHWQRYLSPKKIQLTELAMDKMTLRLLLWLNPKDMGECAMDGFTETFRQLLGRPRSELDSLVAWLDSNIRATKSLDGSAEAEELAPYRGLLSRYSSEVTQRSLHNASLLESNITWMFQRRQNGEITYRQLILDMLHNITVSPALPTLQSFNKILDGLSATNTSPRVTEYVIRAMRTCHVRMNEETIIIILNHFRRTNNYQQFCKYAELIQGQQGGLWVARADVHITDASSGRLVRENRFGKDKVIQKPTPTPEVFQALVDGILYFDGFDAAVRTFKDMAASGWGLSMRGLTSLLRECMENSHWEGGVAVWKQIKAVHNLTKSKGRSEKIQAGTYATMLRLCILCDQKAQYESICKEAIASKNTTRSLLHYMQRLKEAGPQPKAARGSTQTTHGERISIAAASHAPTAGDADIAVAIANDERAEKHRAGDTARHVSYLPKSKAIELGSYAQRTVESQQELFEAQDPLPIDIQNTRLGLVGALAELPAVAVSSAQDPVAGDSESLPAREEFRQQSSHSRAESTISVLDRSQLLGLSTSSAELDVYEITERPMNMVAWGGEGAYCSPV
ncbi:hypothetical protein BDZ85DRAFT_269178 [Elsinoe ampelina]|uniref:Pentatricopeptide repeat domain-containing protein n=1 Tax=Elsinoe ampelina TaxID=302913 RepID=A0A6A6G0G2_9PEZI|nr:hypothetical protein BDZ85DRAFT_269178 [Elsinoe ampelina]